MDSITEIMQLCRLCLVKDEVNIPIFEEHGDIRQILLKISACLPVKVSKEDNLPKNICDGCSCKLDMLYQFWNTSANSEKKLIRWMDQIGVDKLSDKDETAIANSLHPQHSISSNPMILKQEVVDVADNQSTGDDLVPDDLNVSNDAQDYIMQQQQLPYQPVEFQFQQDGFETVAAEDESSNVEVESQPTKRKRRAAAMKALANMESEDEDDPDLINKKIAKTEEQSDDSAGEDPEPTTFVGLPSADDEQPGPSGIGKSSSDAPYFREMGIRKVNISLDVKEKLEKYKAMFEKYKKHYRLKNGVVILGNLAQLDFKKFRPSKAMALYLTSKRVFIKVDRLTPSPAKELNSILDEKKTEIEEKLLIFGKSYQKQQYPCKHCKETFPNELQLKRHKMVHFIKKNQVGLKKSHISRKLFFERHGLMSHIRQHSHQLHHTCKDCNKVFKTSNDFQAHRTDCAKRSKDEVVFKIPVHNPETSFRYRCNICLKKFEDVFEMREHKESHYEKDVSKSVSVEDNNNPANSPPPAEENATVLDKIVLTPTDTDSTVESSNIVKDGDLPSINHTDNVASVSKKSFFSSSVSVNQHLRCNICYDIFEDTESYLEHAEFEHNESREKNDSNSVSSEDDINTFDSPTNFSPPAEEDSTVFEKIELKPTDTDSTPETSNTVKDGDLPSINDEIDATDKVPSISKNSFFSSSISTDEHLRCDICYDIFEDTESYLEHVEFEHKESHEKNDSNSVSVEDNINTFDSLTNSSLPAVEDVTVFEKIELKPIDTDSTQESLNPVKDGDLPSIKFVINATDNVASNSKNSFFSSSVDQNLRCDLCYDIFEDTESYLEHAEFHKEISSSTPTRKSSEQTDSSSLYQSGNEQTVAKCTNVDTRPNASEEFKPKIFLKKLQDLMPINLQSRRTSGTDIDKKKKPKRVLKREDLKCDECKVKFKRYRSFRRHNRLAKTKYKCSMCVFSTCSFKGFKDHFRFEHNIKFFCLKCKLPCDVKAHKNRKPKSKSSECDTKKVKQTSVS